MATVTAADNNQDPDANAGPADNAQTNDTPVPTIPSPRIDISRVKLLKLEDQGDNNNYDHWASCVKTRLEQLKLWKFIEGPESDPPVIPPVIERHEYEAVMASDGTTKIKVVMPGNEAEVELARKKAEPWKDGDLAARALLQEAIPAHKGTVIDHAKSAKEVWVALQEDYCPANEARAATIHQKILGYICTPELDVTKWLDNIRSLYYQLVRQAPDRMSDTEFASTIANLIPNNDEWRPFATLLSNDMTKARQAGRPMRYSEVVQRIKAEDWNHRKDDPEIFPQIHTLESMRRKRTSTVANFTHAPNPKRQEKSCSNKYCLRKTGHATEECLAYGGAKCGQYPEWWSYRRDIHLPPNQRTHATKNGNARSAKPAHATTPQASVAKVEDADVQHTDTPADVTAALTQEDGFYVLNSMVVADPIDRITCNTIALQPSTARSVEIFHDSGANRHIFFDKSHFSSYREISPLRINGFGSELSSAAIGVGSVVVQTTCGGQSSTLTLTDVLHVPSARLNLMSQGCLERRGVSLRSTGGKMVLSIKGRDVLAGYLQANNLFKLDAVPVPRSLQERISPTISLADRISPPVAPRKETARKVSQDFFTA